MQNNNKTRKTTLIITEYQYNINCPSSTSTSRHSWSLSTVTITPNIPLSTTWVTHDLTVFSHERLRGFLLHSWNSVGLRRHRLCTFLSLSTDASIRHGKTSYKQCNARHEAVGLANELPHKPTECRNGTLWWLSTRLLRSILKTNAHYGGTIYITDKLDTLNIVSKMLM